MCAFSVNRETINWLQLAPADDGFHQFCGEVADGGTDGGDRLGQEAGDRVLDLRGLLDDAVARIDPLDDLMDCRFDAGRDRQSGSEKSTSNRRKDEH